MVVLRDIDVDKRIASGCFDNIPEDMLTLDEYLEIAKRCIGFFAAGYLAARMLNDEDAISHVADALMTAHCRWKKDMEGGRTLRSYLNQCASWSIQVWKTKLYHLSQQANEISLNQNVGNNYRTQRHEVVEDKKASEPFDILFDNSKETAAQLINSDCLTKTQSYCLYERYVGNKKLQEIANEIGVSRQAVDQHIKKAIKRLQKEYAN
jgi:RNA polymerase sigma factor (sigma-70 family)